MSVSNGVGGQDRHSPAGRVGLTALFSHSLHVWGEKGRKGRLTQASGGAAQCGRGSGLARACPGGGAADNLASQCQDSKAQNQDHPDPHPQ